MGRLGVKPTYTRMISSYVYCHNPTICNRNSNNPLIVGYVFILFLNSITTQKEATSYEMTSHNFQY
nr:MAG TPA: hypothetical protein [Caudoviricetes sp.]